MASSPLQSRIHVDGHSLRSHRSVAAAATAAICAVLLTAGCSDNGSDSSASSSAQSTSSANSSASQFQSAAPQVPERAPAHSSANQSPSATTTSPSATTLPYPNRTDCQAADEYYVSQIDLSFADTNYRLTDAFQAESASGVTYIAGTAENQDPSISTNGVWLFKDGSYYTLPGDAGTLTPGFVDGSEVLQASLDDPQARNVVECNANAVWQHGR